MLNNLYQVLSIELLDVTATCLLVNIRIGMENQYNSNVFFYKLVNIINI